MKDHEFAALTGHFNTCPAPPDGGCTDCHRYERERRTRCHGTVDRCARGHAPLPELTCDFSDAGVLGAEATADYCYAHQAFCETEGNGTDGE